MVAKTWRLTARYFKNASSSAAPRSCGQGGLHKKAPKRRARSIKIFSVRLLQCAFYGVRFVVKFMVFWAFSAPFLLAQAASFFIALCICAAFFGPLGLLVSQANPPLAGVLLSFAGCTHSRTQAITLKLAHTYVFAYHFCILSGAAHADFYRQRSPCQSLPLD